MDDDVRRFPLLFTEIRVRQRFSERRIGDAMTVGRCLLLLGFVCLAIMVLTHIAEGFRVFRGMGMGLARQSR